MQTHLFILLCGATALRPRLQRRARLAPRMVFSATRRENEFRRRATRRAPSGRNPGGIVEEMGTVHSLTHDKDMTMWDGSIGKGTELVVDGPVASDGAYIGCSIAVNGVCLTATRLEIDGAPRFSLGLSPETLRRTNLGALKDGDPVNLERRASASSSARVED